MKGGRGISFPKPEQVTTVEPREDQLELLTLNFAVRRRAEKARSSDRSLSIRQKIARWLEQKL
jgi:hypothetical protein